MAIPFAMGSEETCFTKDDRSFSGLAIQPASPNNGRPFAELSPLFGLDRPCQRRIFVKNEGLAKLCRYFGLRRINASSEELLKESVSPLKPII